MKRRIKRTLTALLRRRYIEGPVRKGTRVRVVTVKGTVIVGHSIWDDEHRPEDRHYIQSDDPVHNGYLSLWKPQIRRLVILKQAPPATKGWFERRTKNTYEAGWSNS